MSDVLLGQSYYLHFDPKLYEAMQPYPPLGTMYVAAYLREQGYDVALFDAMLAQSEEEWANALDCEQPDFAIIYEDNFNYLSKMCLLRMRQAAFTMVDMAKQRGCIAIVAGSDATDRAELYLAAGADYVLLGEGDYTLLELLGHLTSGSDGKLQDILGLAYVSDPTTKVKNVPLESPISSLQSQFSPNHSSISINPRRPDIKHVNDLPFPAWDLIDVQHYKDIWYERHGYFSMNMVTTRGCPYHCNWCAKPLWGQRYNARSPENVVAELKWLKETYRPDHIWFADDIVGIKPTWWSRFAELVEQEDARVPFKCLSRVDLLLRQGEVDAMKRAGCDIVWVGAESGSQNILYAMEKGTTVEQIYKAADLLHRYGIKIAFFLQFGYPSETREDIEKTLQMVRDCRPDDVGMSVSYPLPGTQFYDRVKDQLGDQHNWKDSEDMVMLYNGPYATEFYRQLHTVLHKEYRARKYRHELGHVARHPGQFKSRHVRQAATMTYHTLTLSSARRKLDRLQQAPHRGIDAPAPTLTYRAAATPTPQHDEHKTET